MQEKLFCGIIIIKVGLIFFFLWLSVIARGNSAYTPTAKSWIFHTLVICQTAKTAKKYYR